MTNKTYKIDRARWRTGYDGPNKTGFGNTELLNEEAYMCCLGFMCEQDGVSRDDLYGKGFPEDIKGWLPIDSCLVTRIMGRHDRGEVINSGLSKKAADINDCGRSLPEEKEEKLKELFAEEGIVLEFSGCYES